MIDFFSGFLVATIIVGLYVSYQFMKQIDWRGGVLGDEEDEEDDVEKPKNPLASTQPILHRVDTMMFTEKEMIDLMFWIDNHVFLEHDAEDLKITIFQTRHYYKGFKSEVICSCGAKYDFTDYSTWEE